MDHFMEKVAHVCLLMVLSLSALVGASESEIAKDQLNIILIMPDDLRDETWQAL
jgi:hypothetical protein